MRAKHVSKFFFFTAPNYSEILNYGDPKDIIDFKEIEEKILNEKRKENPDKKKLRKMRLRRTVFKKKIIENFTYCPYDVYIAINKSSLPSKPQVLDGIRHTLYFDAQFHWDYEKADVEFLKLKSEGTAFLCYLQSPKRIPTPLGFYEHITRNNDTNQRMSSERKKVQRIARAVQKSRTFLEQPNVYKISLTTTEKKDLCYYLGKGLVLSNDIHHFRRHFLDEFSFWPKFLGSQIGLKKSIFIGENRTGLGYYHFHEKGLWLSEEKELILMKEKTPKENTRLRIPDDVQIFVWNRDNGVCVKCGSNENLAFDHIIPHSLGGSDTKRNLQILCDTCNQKKGNKIGG